MVWVNGILSHFSSSSHKKRKTNLSFIDDLKNYLAHNYYWTASHAVGCRAKERSSTPSFVQKFEKKFAYTPSASPYFTDGGGTGHPPKTPEPSSASPEQPKEPKHPTSADVPKSMETNHPPILTTTNIKQVAPTNKDNRTTNEPTTTTTTTDKDNE